MLIIPIILIIGLLFMFLCRESKTEHEKWLEEELERNPDYINWLKEANNGKDYKTGLEILTKIKRDESNLYKRWLKRMKKIGKY